MRIMVPKMADGNNFGVDVQLAVLKEITEASQWLTQQASELPQYHEHRANAFEKCAVRKTTEKMTSSGNRQQKGGKEGEQTHEHTTTDNKEIIQETECKLPDLRDFIADIDVKWYCFGCFYTRYFIVRFFAGTSNFAISVDTPLFCTVAYATLWAKIWIRSGHSCLACSFIRICCSCIIIDYEAKRE